MTRCRSTRTAPPGTPPSPRAGPWSTASCARPARGWSVPAATTTPATRSAWRRDRASRSARCPRAAWASAASSARPSPTSGGDPSALALTGATAIFFWSGECYHRAWANGFPPIEALNRRGDFLSGVGALMLGTRAPQPRPAGPRGDLGPAARPRQVRQRPPLAADARLAARLAELLPHARPRQPRPGDPRHDPRPHRRPRHPHRRHPVERLADAAGLPRLLRLLVPRRPDALRLAGQVRQTAQA